MGKHPSDEQHDPPHGEPTPARGGPVAFVEVAIDAPVFVRYTYRIAAATARRMQPGQRVVVPLGAGNQRAVGFVVGFRNEAPGGVTVKDVSGLLDARPMMPPAVYDLACKVADYYCCPLGTALAATVPAAVRKRAGSKGVVLVEPPEQPGLAPQLTPPQKRVLAAMSAHAARPERGTPLRADELCSTAKCSLITLRKMADLGLLKLRTVEAWDLEPAIPDEFPPHPARGASPPFPSGEGDDPGDSPPLHKGGHGGVASPDSDDGTAEPVTPPDPNDDQRRALDAILPFVRPRRFGVFLLHGVTGSGKTEVYLRAMAEVVAAGGQAIVLVPEISLTPQTQRRFLRRFGDGVAVLHSGLTDAARHREWQRIRDGEATVVVGARSAVFAPCRRLGIIVVDEEHDAGYKQADPAPRYHARDVAVLRGSIEGCPVVLGSATPSLESLHNSRTRSHFRKLDLPRRVAGLSLPAVEIVDMRAEMRRRPGPRTISGALQAGLTETFAAGGQAILLLNRRGHSTFLLCPRCGFVERCDRCETALVWHRSDGAARCHYCGLTRVPAEACPACNGGRLQRMGEGTQRLEDELARLFPDVPTARMDTDSTQATGAHAAILESFARGEVRMLLGTQMIAKGLHFPRVTLVGVVSADTALAIPDFRAAERTFQLIAQVAGRTGRGAAGGRVIVQTMQPDLPVIRQACAHDYAAFAEAELAERRGFDCPPSARMVACVVRDEDFDRAKTAAERLFAGLAEIVSRRSLPVRFRSATAVPAPLARLDGRFRWMVAFAADGPGPVQELLAAARPTGLLTPAMLGADVVVDVDPVTVL